MNAASRKLPVLLIALVLGTGLGAGLPARAQESTTLRVAHGGALLPPQTAVVVLDRPATLRQNDLYQPEFVAPAAFPRDASLVLRRDTLDARQHTRARYPKTQQAGRVYFVYALSPEGTLYWSYSATTDSLKFDVVDRGVMAVAPVRDAAARRVILDTFFTPEAGPDDEDRVVVVMRGGSAAAESLAVQAYIDSLLAAAAADTAAPQAAQAPPPATAARPLEPSRAASLTVSRRLAYGLLLGAVLLVGLLAALAYTWRRELSVLRRERLDVWTQQAPAMMHPSHPDRLASGDGSPSALDDDMPERRLDLMQALVQAEQARDQVEQEYAVLRARYSALRRELELRQTERG